MKTLAKLLCALMIIMLPSVLQAADSFRDTQGWSITGSVFAVDDGGKHIHIYDRSRNEYKIEMKDARVYSGDREMRASALRKGDVVRIYGRERGSREVDARTVYVLDRNDEWYRDSRNRVTVYGEVRKVDTGKNRLEVKTDKRTEKIQLTRDTDIYSAKDRKVKLDYLRRGDDVRVEGYQDRGNEITATAVYIRDDSTRGERGDREIRARVVKTPGLFDNTLKVEDISRGSDRDTFSVDVSKDTRITRGNSRISLREIRTGETVTIEGSWRGSTMVASRITASGFPVHLDSRFLTGRIDRIDYQKREITLNTTYGRRVVHADRAQIYRGSSRREFRDLGRGDQITVRGSIDGDEIDAERIEIARTNVRDDRVLH